MSHERSWHLLPIGPPDSSPYVDYGNGEATIRDYGVDGKAVLDYDFGRDHRAGNDLTAGGTPIDKPGYPGTAMRPPEGGFIGLRPVSTSGDPAIDVNVPSVPDIKKIHFPPGAK
jgi:hypothetical protein